MSNGSLMLEINEEERTVVIELLERALADYPEEISRCKTNIFKTMLKDHMTKVESVLNKMKNNLL